MARPCKVEVLFSQGSLGSTGWELSLDSFASAISIANRASQAAVARSTAILCTITLSEYLEAEAAVYENYLPPTCWRSVVYRYMQQTMLVRE